MATAHVGAAHVDVFLEGCVSRKDRRSRIAPIRAALEGMGASVAELSDDSRWDRVQLGVAIVARDPAGVDRILTETVPICERDPRNRVLSMVESTDRIHPDDA